MTEAPWVGTPACCPRCFANVRARRVQVLAGVVVLTDCDCTDPSDLDEPLMRAHVMAADWFREDEAE